MKKALFSLLITFVALSFNSCSSSDDEDNDVTDKVKVTIKCTECPSGTFFFYLNSSPTGTWNFLGNGGDNPTYDIRLTDGTELSYSEKVFMENGKDKSILLMKNSSYIYLFVPQERPAYYRHGTLKVFDIDTYLPYEHVW